VKIIFATRVAETALTINDVSVVIDIGVDRFIYFDQMRSM
jgi:HrpA-like RNA helicase